MTYLLDDAIVAIAKNAQTLLSVAETPIVTPANPKFDADLAIPTFMFARELGKSPAEVAIQLAEKLQHATIAKAEAASGFVNIWLSNDTIGRAFKQVNTTFGQHTLFGG